MDQLNEYRECIRRVLQDYALWNTQGRSTAEVVIDAARDHYQVISHGWDGANRIHDVIVHVDIIDGKVWVQHDATNRPIARRLHEEGIPRSDIVLGFYSPQRRAQSNYAVS